MPPHVLVHLPVADLPRSRAFYAALGFGFDDRFAEAGTACVVLAEQAGLLLSAGAPGGSVRLALARPSRDAVDALLAAGLAAGGAEGRASQSEPGLYRRALRDPDGHALEPFWMDPAARERTLGDEIGSAVDA